MHSNIDMDHPEHLCEVISMKSSVPIWSVLRNNQVVPFIHFSPFALDLSSTIVFAIEAKNKVRTTHVLQRTTL